MKAIGLILVLAGVVSMIIHGILWFIVHRQISILQDGGDPAWDKVDVMWNYVNWIWASLGTIFIGGFLYRQSSGD
jgi:hypothetical protein